MPLWKTRQLLELVRFSHTIFALPFALLAAVMAWMTPVPGAVDVPVAFRWRDLIGILLCMVFARSAAMAFNRLIDRRLDAQNPRTRSRHLPAGILSVRSVVVFTVLCSLGFIASTLLFWPNPLPLYLSLPVLALLLSYSYSKRFTQLAHFWLGAALMLAPIAAWIAIRGLVLLAQPLDLLPAILLGLAVLLWVAGFDIIYACQDAEFDRQAQLRSIPAAVGTRVALWIAAACHAAMVGVLALLPVLASSVEFGVIYWCGIAAVAVLLLVEHYLVRPDDLSRVNVAFFQVNAIVSIGLFIVGTIDLLT